MWVFFFLFLFQIKGVNQLRLGLVPGAWCSEIVQYFIRSGTVEVRMISPLVCRSTWCQTLLLSCSISIYIFSLANIKSLRAQS